MIYELERSRWTILVSENVFHRFVIIDHRISWYGIIDVLGTKYK
ncbi:hypothetical protein [Alkalibacterium sp. 20]|nr:hypothetical protein [Alkalibacterium sp. 20]